MIARIRIIGGPHSGRTIALSGKQFLIGRDAGCDLKLDCEYASRHHCLLLIDDLTIRLRDLGSKNGTYVNGRRASSKEETLAPSDTIAIGTTIFVVEVATGTETRTAEAAATGLFDTNTVDNVPGATPQPPAPRQPPVSPPAQPQPLEQQQPPAENDQRP